MKLEGQNLPRFPIVRRIQVDEAQMIATTKAGLDVAGVYAVVPGAGTVPAVQVLVLSSDQAVNLRLNGQTNGSIPLNAGGLLLLIDGNLSAGVTTNATINNPGADTANLTGVVGGS